MSIFVKSKHNCVDSVCRWGKKRIKYYIVTDSDMIITGNLLLPSPPEQIRYCLGSGGRRGEEEGNRSRRRGHTRAGASTSRDR